MSLAITPAPRPRCSRCHRRLVRPTPSGLGPVCRKILGLQVVIPGCEAPPPATVVCSGQVARCSCARCGKDRFEALEADLFRDFEARLDAEVGE